MAGDTIITVVGNLTADPELRYTPSGIPVVNFTIASTPRVFDKKAQEWRDGESLFLRCGVWRDYAEHVAASLTKGMRVIVQGRLVQRTWETEQGERRTMIELQAEEVGPVLRYATAQVTRVTKGGGMDGGSAASTGSGQVYRPGQSAGVGMSPFNPAAAPSQPQRSNWETEPIYEEEPPF